MAQQRKRRRRRSRRRRMRRRIILCGMALVLIILLIILAWPLISGRPSFKLTGDSHVTVAQGDEYVDEGAAATRYGKDISDQMYMTDDVDMSTLGDYTVKYNVDGRWKTYSVTRKVTVTDQTPPEIILNGDEVTIVDDFSEYTEPGATAIDVNDGDVSDTLKITGPEQVNEYTQEVTYTAKDSAGNEGTLIRQIQLYDEVGPEISLNGDSYVTTKRYSEFDDPWVTATDNRDGDISESVKRTGYIDIYRTGTYEVTYTATDTSGNTATCNRTVEVENADSPEDHVIYLTFDDGPSSDVTVQILDTLKENGIQATFFILDYSEDKLPIIRRMLDEGHTIGIHGYSHEYDEIYTSVDAFMESINTLAEKLKEDTGYEAFCMRFPGGSSNTVSRHYCEGVMTALVEKVTDEGWMYFDWNVDSTDASGNNVAAQTLISSVESELDPNTGNVILMHDTSAKQTTADALQTVIDYGKSNGYSFAPISEDTMQVHHAVNN